MKKEKKLAKNILTLAYNKSAGTTLFEIEVSNVMQKWYFTKIEIKSFLTYAKNEWYLIFNKNNNIKITKKWKIYLKELYIPWYKKINWKKILFWKK